jgi:hypothetical protein
MKPSVILLAILVPVCAAAGAQVVPATTGPHGLPLSGTLRYDLNYSQMAQFYGGPEGNAQISAVSGDLAYTNASPARPFNLTYSGGDMWDISGGSGANGVYQHLLASQGVLGRNWAVNLSDNVSYMPQAPTTGFSGIPGLGTLPGLLTGSSQPILTLNTTSVNNLASASFNRSLNYATSFSVLGSYAILRFPDGNGLEDDQLQVSPQLTRRLNARNSIFGEYAFSHISYPGVTFTMGTQSALFGFQRTWSRGLRTSVSAGPEWIQSSESTVIPSSTDLTVNANATYSTKTTSVALSYLRATSGGSGVIEEIGIHSNDVMAEFSRDFGKKLTLSATGAYLRTQGLQQACVTGLQTTCVTGSQQTGVSNAVYGGVAATRRLGRSFTVFANYTATHQSSNFALPTNAISGLSQVIGFGIGYSPREMHFRK